MKKILNFLLVLVFSLGILSNTAFAASLEKYLTEHGPDEYAIIYGSIDSSSMNTTVKTTAMLRYPTKSKIQISAGARNDMEDFHNQKKGYFWAIGKPGQYYLNELATADRRHYIMNIDNAKIKSRLLTVDKGALLYCGSAKFIQVKENQFSLIAVAFPGEKAILEDLLQHAQGTKWEEVIINKLKSI